MGPKAPRAEPAGDAKTSWTFHLFIVGRGSVRSERAVLDLRRALDRYLAGRYRLEVIDLREHPELAAQEQLIVLPAVIRKRPEPQVKLTGDLSDEAHVAEVFGLAPDQAAGPRGERERLG